MILPEPVSPSVERRPKDRAAQLFRLPFARELGDLAVVRGGWEECPASDVRRQEAAGCYALEFIAAAEGELHLAGRHYALGPSLVFVRGPRDAAPVQIVSDYSIRRYFVEFAGTKAPTLLRQCRLQAGRAAHLSASLETRQAFDTLIRLGASAEAGMAPLCALQLELLLRVIGRATAPVARTERGARATFERCRQQIDIAYLRLPSAEAAARACHIDISHLCRLFHRFQGEPPFRYLQRRQMEWAALRLETSGKLIREVADELGIDPFQFSRTFKRVHGLSPSAFLGARPQRAA